VPVTGPGPSPELNGTPFDLPERDVTDLTSEVSSVSANEKRDPSIPPDAYVDTPSTSPPQHNPSEHKMNRLETSLALVCLATTPALGQTYTAEVLGPGVVINDMNLSGEIVGWTLSGGVQAFVVGPDRPYALLPLPSGYASAWAQGINDAGVIVGSASTAGFPEFGEAVAWTPDGQGSYAAQVLPKLTGFTQSVATDVNNRGDIVGYSIFPGFQGGPTTWFNAPGGALNLTDLGAPSSPKEINDSGMLVGISGSLFDIDTLLPVPLPPFPANMNGFQGWAIAEDGSLAGTGIHGSKRSASIWTPGTGWLNLSGEVDFSAPVQAFDIDSTSGAGYAELPTPAAYLPGSGLSTLAGLLEPAQQGQWSFQTNLGGGVNANGQIAAIGSNTAGESGVTLLTPLADVQVYCTAKTSSEGCVAAIGTSSAGSPVSGASDYSVTAGGVQELKNGLLFASASGAAALPFNGGVLCMNPPLKRGPVLGSGGSTPNGCNGSYATLVNDGAILPLGLDAGPGNTAQYQYWYRDPQNGAGQLGTALSNAVQLDFQ